MGPGALHRRAPVADNSHAGLSEQTAVQRQAHGGRQRAVDPADEVKTEYKKERLLLKRGRRSFCALSRGIPLICEFSENFQKSMSFSRPLMWLLSSRGKSFDAVFTFLLWMLRYRSRGNTTLAPPGSASADRLKRKSKLMSILGGDVVVIEIGSFLSGFTNPMSFFEGCRLRLYSRKIF